MQNTYQEKSLDPIDKDFLFGKKLEGGIKLSTVSDFKPAGDLSLIHISEPTRPY